MKTRAGIRYFLTAASVVAALAMQTLNGFAEDTKADAKAQATAIAAMRGYDLVISDGVLYETNGARSTAEIPAVMDVLRKRYPDVNIVIAPELSQVMVADLKLHAHDLPEMLEAIRVASGNKFDWSGPSSPRPGAIDPATGLPLAGAQVDLNSGLFTLRPVEQTVEQTKENERVVEAFNIGPFLEHIVSELRSQQKKEFDRDEFVRFRMAVTDRGVKELQDNIINTVASFKQTDEASVRATLKFQFHSGTSLLVAIGPRADVEVTRKMMNALTADTKLVRMDSIRTELVDMQGEETQPVSVEAIPVKFAKVESAYAAAMSLLTDKRSKVVLTDARSRTLIVQATKAEMVALRAAIEQLDQAARPSGSGSSGGSGSVPQKDH